MHRRSTAAALRAVFQAGPSAGMHWVQTGGAGSVSGAGTRPGGDQMNGNAVMYHTGKIVTFGGGRDYERVPAVKATSIITISGTTASARASTPMQFERAYCTGVVMPDGKVIVMGGQPYPVPFDDTNSVLPTGAMRLVARCQGCVWLKLMAICCNVASMFATPVQHALR